MKHLLITLFLFSSHAAFGQAGTPPTNYIKLWWANDKVISVQDSGQKVRSLPYTQFSFVDVGPYVNVVIQGSGRQYTFSKIQNQAGTAYSSVSADAVIAAINAAAPSSSGGGGSGGSFTAATIGTAPSVPTSYTGASGTISTTNTIYMLMKNTGSAAATVTYGGQSFSLPANTDMEFPSLYDYTSNKYAPYAALSLDATGTTVKLYKTPKQ